MRDLKHRNATWQDGEQVSGSYCGVAYAGTICDHDYMSRRTPDGRNFIFAVDLSQPISVYGAERHHVEIWTNGDDTIFAAQEPS